MVHEERHSGHTRRTELSTEKAKSLAFELVEAAEEHGGPIQDDDGMVRAPWLQRKGDRLWVDGEPEGYVDISDGSPKPTHRKGSSHPDAGLVHIEYPVRELKGWHNTGDGVVLISTSGASWRPEAYIPSEDR
jgi:hypothetical protein